MEVSLVKEQVKIIPVSEAFSKTDQYNDYMNELEICLEYRNMIESAAAGDDDDDDNCDDAISIEASSSKSQDDDDDDFDVTLLTVSDWPVAFKSICSDSDANEHSERFPRKLEWMLKKHRGDKFANMKLELIIANKAKSLEGYFLLSSRSPDGSKVNVFQRLDDEFASDLHDCTVDLALCHLPTGDDDDLVTSEHLINLKAETNDLCTIIYRGKVGNPVAIEIPVEMKKWWTQGTGFIYLKLSVHVNLHEWSVKKMYRSSAANIGLLRTDREFADLEIRCRDGKIVKCHGVLLAGMSSVFRAKYKMMVTYGKKGVPCRVKLVETSEEVVEAFLEYIYCGLVKLGVWKGCAVGFELFRLGREYKVDELWEAMEEIIMAKECSDFEYFSVESALDLFLYAREDTEKLKHLRDKAVRVLHSYLMNNIEKILDSKEYQGLLENQPEVARELCKLYIMLE